MYQLSLLYVPGPSCFPAGTSVWSSQGAVPFEGIRPVMGSCSRMVRRASWRLQAGFGRHHRKGSGFR